MIVEHTRECGFSVVQDLKECSQSRNLTRGKLLHFRVIRSGLEANRFVLSSLTNMYAKCGSMVESQLLFDGLVWPDIIDWNCLIQGYVEIDENQMALEIYHSVRFKDPRTFVAVLCACARLATGKHWDERRCLELARSIHSQAVETGCCNAFVESQLVHTYGKLGCLSEARRVFNSMRRRNVVSWTALLQAYVENGENLVALEAFDEMIDAGECCPNSRTYVAALMACVALARGEEHENLKRKWLQKGENIYKEAAERLCVDSFMECTLMNLYAKCGEMELARGVFEKMSKPNVVAWNVLLQGYVDNHQSRLTLELFEKMEVEADAQTFAAVMMACGGLAAERSCEAEKKIWLEKGKELYSKAVAGNRCLLSDWFLENVCVEMFGKCGSMSDAQNVFDSMPQGNVVAWTLLLQAYFENHQAEQALELFFKGLEDGYIPNERTFVVAFSSCAEEASDLPSRKRSYLQTGKIIHSLALRFNNCSDDVFVSNKMIFMYSQCGSMLDARVSFDKMPDPNLVSWNCLAQGYAINGESQSALKLIAGMKKKNPATFLTALLACKNLAAAEAGEKLHREIKECGLEQEPMIATSLIDFYGKCGNTRAAKKVFDSTAVKRVETWNALLCGLSQQGDADEVFRVYEAMDVRPSEMTLTHLLTACSRAGMADKAKVLFEEMEVKHGVAPNEVHYNCMVDVLSRANLLEDALEMLGRFKPDAISWTTLLSACSNWKNARVWKVARQALLELEIKDSAAYVLMINKF